MSKKTNFEFKKNHARKFSNFFIVLTTKLHNN